MSKHRTPDGRVIAYGETPASSAWSAANHGQGTLAPFIEACLAALPAHTLSSDRRLGLFLFFLGAADRMWQRSGLDDTRFPAFAADLLQTQGVSKSAAVTIAQELPQLRQVESARTIMLQGADLFEEWQDGQDSDAVLRLNQLVLEWDKLGLGSGERD
jgi:hypothetical protein